jgi:hypothetical protein
MSTLNSQRHAFEKDVYSSLRPLMGPTGWRKRDNFLFCQSDGYYQEATIAVDRAAPATRVSFSFKPMTVDPIYWEISGVAKECSAQPLSFRSNWLGTCRSLPFLEASVEQPGDSPVSVAGAIMELCRKSKDVWADMLGAASFSELVSRYPEHVARGTFRYTLIMSLIAEGDLAAARATADSYIGTYANASKAFHRVGKSFEHQIIRWLDARRNPPQEAPTGA